LVPAFALRVVGDSAYYLVHRRADLVRPALGAFVTWLLAEMASYVRVERRTRRAGKTNIFVRN
jgi:hypothetical protein